MDTRPPNRPSPSPARPAPGGSSRRRGFSFIEVLFAVMILGIGFILIAGVFPVAISQTATTREETVAASLVNGAAAAVASIPNLQDVTILANDGAVHRLTGDQWRFVKGNQILPDDPRCAWIPLLKRDVADYRGQPPTVAQLIIVPVQVRERGAFASQTNPPTNNDERDLHQTGADKTAYANLMPWPVKVTLKEGDAGPDTVTLSNASGSLGDAGIRAAAPGAVLVIAQGGVFDKNNLPIAGRVYRLGNGEGTQYELLPGNDMAVTNGRSEEPSTGSPVDAWIIGQGMTAPGRNALITFSGGNMAIGTYTTYIPLR